MLCVVLNVIEFGTPLDEAIAAPRLHQQWFPDQIEMEAKLAEKYPDAVAELTKRGHKVVKVRSQGDAHSIWWDAKMGTYQVVTDPRRASRPAP